MEDELVRKIKEFFRKENREECDVVCLMVKIRKLLDKLKLNNQYKTLKSYCDWALHDKISSNKACQEILKEVEGQYKKAKINKNLPDLSLGVRFYELEQLKGEISLFLDKFNVNHNFSDEKIWANFRGLFQKNLADCPLEPSRENKLIERFVFKTSSDDNSINFEVKFTDNPTTFRGGLINS